MGELKSRVDLSRVVLVAGLLVAGLLMAGMGTALGVGDQFNFDGKRVSLTVMSKNGTDVITIWEDGKVVKKLLPGRSYTIKTSGNKILISEVNKMTEEEMEKQQAEAEAKLEKVLEIAKNDSRVRELIDGKAYKVVCFSIETAGETETAVLTLDVEGTLYKVSIDLNSGTVESVEEVGAAPNLG
ncbi:MAG: hypothetical protein J7K45_01805 [Thaumarchaeota archaeon]|nr:hypothetical protein [Nitrososphaerota archaeon]